MRLLALAVLVLVVVACSDRVPAPVTPTPSPRPGYPPAPASELPEGVLFVSSPTSQPPLFGLNSRGEWDEFLESSSLRTTSPDGMRAALVTSKGNWPTGMGLLTASSYNGAAAGPWSTGSPITVWSRDGKRLAYTIPDDSAGGTVHVWTLDVESGKRQRRTREADVYALLGWSAKGELLAKTPDELLLLGVGSRELALPAPREIVDAALSPDGRSVALKLGVFEQDPDTEVTYIHSTGIWVLGLTGGAWREIVDLAGEPPGVQTTGGDEMSWSPDGRRMTLHRTRVDEGGLIADGLSVVNVPTGEETRVHDQGFGWESWSPDGRYLAYMYYNTKAGSASELKLGLLGPDGETREVEANVRQMAWTPDGRLLVDVPARLSLLDPEIMEVEEIHDREGKTISAFVESSVWSPSGRYVALSTPSDALHKSSLYIVDTETGRADVFLDRAGFWARAWLRDQGEASSGPDRPLHECPECCGRARRAPGQVPSPSCVGLSSGRRAAQDDRRMGRRAYVGVEQAPPLRTPG